MAEYKLKIPGLTFCCDVKHLTNETALAIPANIPGTCQNNGTESALNLAMRYFQQGFTNSARSFTLRAHRLDPWWRHQMETFSALLSICAGNSPVPGEFPAQRPALMFSLICVWNGWVNNREAGDLRRYCAHYDVTVMQLGCLWHRRKGRQQSPGQYIIRSINRV